MKVSQFLTCLVASQAISAASIPESNIALSTLEERRVVPASEIVSPEHTLERRKGGGGRGGGGGGRGGGGSGGRSGGSSSSSSSGASARTFGGGRYYAGGAQKPYSAGKATPGGIRPGLLLAPAALFLIMPGIWLYSVYPYHYNNNYRFYNETARDDDDDNDNNNNRRAAIWERQTQGRNESLPVTCLCQEYNPCGCEENNDNQDYLDELVGNGSYAALNKTLVTVSEVNGTKTLVLNGTLPNGTDTEGAAAPSLRVGNFAGYYAVAALVVAGVML